MQFDFYPQGRLQTSAKGLMFLDSSPTVEFRPKTENIIASNLELVSLTENGQKISFSISKARDKDGVEIFVPRLREGKDKSLFDDSNLPEFSLSIEQKQRLLYCMTDLDMPLTASCQLALNNPEAQLLDFKRSKVKLLIGFKGTPLSGKTSTLAALVAHHKISALSLEVFSPQTLQKYTDDLLHLRKKPTKEEFRIELRKSIDSSKAIPPEDRSSTIRPLLDTLVSVCEVGALNSTLFVDTTGFDPASRNPDIFDLVATQSLDGVWELPNTDFDLDVMWNFVQDFPNQEFKNFIAKRQIVTTSVKHELVKTLRHNH